MGIVMLNDTQYEAVTNALCLTTFVKRSNLPADIEMFIRYKANDHQKDERLKSTLYYKDQKLGVLHMLEFDKRINYHKVSAWTFPTIGPFKFHGLVEIDMEGYKSFIDQMDILTKACEKVEPYEKYSGTVSIHSWLSPEHSLVISAPSLFLQEFGDYQISDKTSKVTFSYTNGMELTFDMQESK